MRQSDRLLYRVILRRVSLPELTALYERTLPEYPALAETIASEIDARLAGESAASEQLLVESTVLSSPLSG